MRVLCTFPGRAGDILWALPTVRAISQAVGQPVDLLIAGEFDGLIPLLRFQPYLNLIEATRTWSLTPPDEWLAPVTAKQSARYDRVLHLGYRGWPQQPLPLATYIHALQYFDIGALAPFDLDTPWIQIPEPQEWALQPFRTLCGFTEEWFELKVGLCHLLDLQNIAAPGSRWVTEEALLDHGDPVHRPADWAQAAQLIQQVSVFIADLSALHVLAVAMGKSVLIVEPSTTRATTDIFWPLGRDGRVKLVRGNDGQATWDAPTVLQAALAARGPSQEKERA